MNTKLSFMSDYMEGAHPAILQRLLDTNMVQSSGYGTDEFSEMAKEKIRTACNAPDADVFFLVGGTQVNATMIDSILRPYHASSQHPVDILRRTKQALSNMADTKSSPFQKRTAKFPQKISALASRHIGMMPTTNTW